MVAVAGRLLAAGAGLGLAAQLELAALGLDGLALGVGARGGSTTGAIGRGSIGGSSTSSSFFSRSRTIAEAGASPTTVVASISRVHAKP